MTMRLTIGFLLVYVASSQTAADTMEKGKFTQERLPGLNAERQEIAKEFGISVPDLVWDEDLVAQISSMSSDCSGWLNTDRSRFVALKPDANGKILDSALNTILSQLVGSRKKTDDDKEWFKKVSEKHAAYANSANDKTLGIFEFYNPLQTKIGCAPKTCTAEITKEIRDGIQKLLKDTQNLFQGNKFSYRYVCLLGPSGAWGVEVTREVGSSASNWSMGAIALISILYSSFL